MRFCGILKMSEEVLSRKCGARLASVVHESSKRMSRAPTKAKPAAWHAGQRHSRYSLGGSESWEALTVEVVQQACHSEDLVDVEVVLMREQPLVDTTAEPHQSFDLLCDLLDLDLKFVRGCKLVIKSRR